MVEAKKFSLPCLLTYLIKLNGMNEVECLFAYWIKLNGMNTLVIEICQANPEEITF